MQVARSFPEQKTKTIFVGKKEGNLFVQHSENYAHIKITRYFDGRDLTHMVPDIASSSPPNNQPKFIRSSIKGIFPKISQEEVDRIMTEIGL